MSTPPPPSNGTSKRKVKMSAATKQDTIDNFDLEVASRLETITSIHASLLSSFLTRQETAIQRIPLEMRRMTVKEIGDRWSGGIRGVMDGLTRGRLEEEEQQEGAKKGEGERGLGAGGGGAKRKRPTTASSLSLTQEKESRMPKSARKNPYTDATQRSTSTPAGPSSHSSKVNKPKSSSSKLTASASTISAPSTSTFKFNPHLPSTPLLTNANGYRRPRRNESIAMSTNGSPLIIDGYGGAEDEDEEGEGSGSGSEEEEEKLLDEEEEMRRLEGKGKGKEVQVLSAGKKGKGRISTIQIHPSLPSSNPSSTSQSTSSSSSLPSFSRTHPTSPSSFDLVIPIPLPNGQTLSFNALSDSPTKLDEILRGSGTGGAPLVSDEERGRIRGQIDRSVRMLGERLGKWKLGGS
ncbi:hypothetical protein BDY24DRAFT_403172 [Mrakia frigida]|uniref:borealin N-terminal domain-containing protein n=1 Tax=Mrakia frigida TaxID=29902 RepID=UPI003FCBF6F5